MKTRFALCLVLSLTIGLLIISPAFAYSQPEYRITVSTDKMSYNHGDIVTINGQGAESYSISIRIISPSGNLITKLSTFKTSAGEFSTLWIIPNGIEKGTYEIEVRDATQFAQTTLSLGLPQTTEPAPEAKIPEWVKNNAGWWADGLIADADFIEGIQYLIQNDIMKIAGTVETVSEGYEEIPAWVRNNAGWWANGLISENDFVSGITWLVEHGIIQVS